MPSVLAPEKPLSNGDTLAEGPSVFLDSSALNLLRGDVTVLTRFLQFMSQDVLQEHIPASKIEIRGSVDPEDDTSQILSGCGFAGCPTAKSGVIITT